MIPHRHKLGFLAFITVFFSYTVVLYAGEYQVSRVIDGDTIEVKKGATKLIVRLVGIDAPEASRKKHEPGQPFSQQATQHLNSLVLNRTADVKTFGTDRYGRALAEVFVGGNNVNLEMVKAGLAKAYRGTPASGHNMEPYKQAEKEPMKANRGMWGLGDKYVSPRHWRKEVREKNG